MAGIQVGDQLLSINGMEVGSAEALREAVNSGKLELTAMILRGTEETELKQSAAR